MKRWTYQITDARTGLSWTGRRRFWTERGARLFAETMERVAFTDAGHLWDCAPRRLP